MTTPTAHAELIERICTLLQSDTNDPRTRWAIALAHHNRLSPTCTIEELDDLMSASAETVSDWLNYLVNDGHTAVFDGNSDLFTPMNEEAARAASDQPFVWVIEVDEIHYVYDWPKVAENLHYPHALDHDSYMADQWEPYTSNLLN